MNYFELFELKPAPAIDKSQLTKKYIALQRGSHPDYFTKANEMEQEDALQQSAAINKAYNIFQQEDKTLEYFLQVKGVLEPNEKYDLPPDFLMEMMDINEAITEMSGEEVKGQVNTFQQELKKEVQSIITGYDPLYTNDQSLMQLKEYYYKKKYLNRILDRLAD